MARWVVHWVTPSLGLELGPLVSPIQFWDCPCWDRIRTPHSLESMELEFHQAHKVVPSTFVVWVSTSTPSSRSGFSSWYPLEEVPSQLAHPSWSSKPEAKRGEMHLIPRICASFTIKRVEEEVFSGSPSFWDFGVL